MNLVGIVDTLVLDNLFYERAGSEVQQVCRVSCSIWFLTFILIEWMLFFFSFTCAAVPKLKTKIYLSFLFTLLSIFMFGFFFAQSLQSVILCVLFVNMFLLFCFILAL